MAKKLDTKILKTNDLETRLVGFKSHFRAINQHFTKSGMTARSDVTRVGCGRQWRDCGKVPSRESRGVRLDIRHCRPTMVLWKFLWRLRLKSDLRKLRPQR